MDVFLLGLGAAAVAVAASVGAAIGDTERIGDYWLQAAIADDGRAQIVEVIDYDFRPQPAPRHPPRRSRCRLEDAGDDQLVDGP